VTAVVVVDGVPFVVPRPHLSRAVAEHLRWCRRDGMIPAPPALDHLLRALGGQRRTERAAGERSADDGLMTPTAVPYAVAAARLGVSERTIRRMAADGRLPVLRYGRVVRIPVEALEVAV